MIDTCKEGRNFRCFPQTHQAPFYQLHSPSKFNFGLVRCGLKVMVMQNHELAKHLAKSRQAGSCTHQLAWSLVTKVTKEQNELQLLPAVLSNGTHSASQVCTECSWEIPIDLWRNHHHAGSSTSLKWLWTCSQIIETTKSIFVVVVPHPQASLVMTRVASIPCGYRQSELSLILENQGPNKRSLNSACSMSTLQAAGSCTAPRT